MVHTRNTSLSLSASQASARRPSLHTFIVPGLLPEERCLLLDMHLNIALLVHVQHAELAQSFPLPPSAARVFSLLLQAYPRPVSYQALFHTLYPVSSEQAAHGVWKRALAVRPIRRAVATLTPLLRHLGLQLVALRGQGYMLAHRHEQTENTSPAQAAPGSTL